MAHAIGILLAVALVAGAQAPAKPNFTGEWVMNAAKSDFGPVPPPDVITRSITHAEPALTIVETQKSAMGEQNTTRKYVTDGTGMTFESNGATVKSSAVWKDSALVIVSTVEAVGLGFDDTMTISADGKALTSIVKISSPQGDVALTVVFDRK